MLVQAAWHILRLAGSDDPLHRWAMRIAKTRGKKIAVVALARKLAGVLWAMWRAGTVYDAGLGAPSKNRSEKKETPKKKEDSTTALTLPPVQSRVGSSRLPG